jgi:hypothetical protein
VTKNKVIVNKFVFYLRVNISRISDNICFMLLCIEMAMYQNIIFYRALCHHASCYIININPMVHMYCVSKGGEISK